jgi:hypothetical protein
MDKMPRVVQGALYRRYCSSLNYFYTKNVNKILRKERSAEYVQYKDMKYEKNEEENLIKYVPKKKFKHKFEQLWKYH